MDAKKSIFRVLSAILLCVCGLYGNAFAENNGEFTDYLDNLDQRMIRLVADANKSIAIIHTTSVARYVTNFDYGKFQPQIEESGGGTGFFVGEDPAGKNCYIVTAAHVIWGAYTIEVEYFTPNAAEVQGIYSEDYLSSTVRKTATIVGIEPTHDLAILKVKEENGCRAVPFGNNAVTGQKIIVIGHPLLSEYLARHGIVSKALELIPVENRVNYLMRIDADINFGNSGSPVLNMRGELVGVLNAMDENRLGLAVPVDYLKILMPRMIGEGGVVRLSSAGVAIVDDREGVAVREVQRGGPAGRAGMMVGDIILRIDGQTITSFVQYDKAVHLKKPGTKVVFEVLRGKQVLSFTITLRERPQ